MRFLNLLAAAQRRQDRRRSVRTIRPGWFIIGIAALASLCIWCAGEPAEPTASSAASAAEDAMSLDELAFRSRPESAETQREQPDQAHAPDASGGLPARPRAGESLPSLPDEDWKSLLLDDSPAVRPAAEANPRVSLVSIAAKTVVVIILVWAGGRALRLYVNRRQATSESAATGDLRVGERACLGPDRSLYIVEAAGQRLLISVDATATTLLAHLNPAGVSQDDDGRDHQPCAEAVCERRDAVAPDDVRARAVKRRLVAEALVRRSREAQENGDGP